MTKEQFTALGISEELAQKAATQSAEELKGYVPKHRFDEVNTENKTLKETIKANETALEDLKKSAGDNAGLKEQLQKLQDEAKEKDKQHQKEMDNLRMNNAVKIALSGKVHDEDLVAGLINKTKLILDEDGKVTGLDDQIKSLKETKAFLFKDDFKKPNYNPQNGVAGTISNPFAKETFNLTEQGRLLKENPAQAKELAAAAGIKLSI